MASTMHKLLHRPLQQALSSPHRKPRNPLNLLPSLLHRPQNQNLCDFTTEEEEGPTRLPAPVLREKDDGFHFFPTFSFGLFLDPRFSSGLRRAEAVDAEKSDESEIMWADSVKKKRKKKMNKHKLRKLRKRIRGYA